jgi:hypothetical protein
MDLCSSGCCLFLCAPARFSVAPSDGTNVVNGVQ